jgi:formate dehydrogenase subunit gamma
MPIANDSKADHAKVVPPGASRADAGPLGVGKPAPGQHERGHQLEVRRYGAFARVNHWVTAISLILLAISGLSLFHPSLFFLTALFGGGQNTRALHPWIGVVLFFSFALLVIKFWRANIPRREDAVWLSKINDVLANREENLPELGKYNAGQKFIFWSMTALIVALIVTGVIIWDQYFYGATAIETKRYAVITHAVLAVVIISIWIMHVYASIWVQGTMSAMISGRVSGGWAWRHHRKWLRDLVRSKSVA